MPQAETRPMIDGDFEGKNVISIDQFTRADIETVIRTAEWMAEARKERSVPQVLEGYMFKAVMFEDSSRTAGSFISAASYLGAKTQQPNLGSSSKNKGESDIETAICFAGQSDGLVIRHSDAGFMDEVAERISKPFQNGGNGRADHPSQTLLDFYTIKQKFGKLDGNRYVLFGDIANNRPARSFVRGAAKFDNNEIFLVSPPFDPMPHEVVDQARAEAEKHGTTIHVSHDLRPLLELPGIFYASRPRKEFATSEAHQRMVEAYRALGYVITREALADANPEAHFTHALPHTFEFADDIYKDPRVFCFEHEDNGTEVRMGALALQHAQSRLRWYGFEPSAAEPERDMHLVAV